MLTHLEGLGCRCFSVMLLLFFDPKITYIDDFVDYKLAYTTTDWHKCMSSQYYGIYNVIGSYSLLIWLGVL